MYFSTYNFWVLKFKNTSVIHRFIFQVDDSDYHRAKCDERVSKLNCVQTTEIQHQQQDQQAVVNEDTRLELTSSLPPLDTQPSDVTADEIKALEDENQSLKQTVEAMKQELAISQSGRILHSVHLSLLVIAALKNFLSLQVTCQWWIR